ncbi:MAG: efflux RND transporter permease subunit [Bacteroidetes bacterium]|nr:efflux RND transporter permease subunit [Bacteroidota bacterium]
MDKFYVSYRSPIAVFLLLLLVAGGYALTNIKTGLFPDITFPKIKIIAENGEQPIDNMMVTVTVPLENAVKRVEELRMIRSTTSRGSCEISAFLNWNSDVDLGKQRIEAQITAIRQSLPPGVVTTVEKMNPSILPVMGFSLHGAGHSAVELRDLAEYTIKPILARIEGVSDVAVTGGKVKEYQIVLDAMRMSNFRITPAVIENVLAQSNFIASNGFMTDFNRLYLTLTDAAVDNLEELRNTVVLTTAQGVVRLRDVADVHIGERREFVRINADGDDVPLIALLKQPKANLIDVTDAVHARLDEIAAILPPGVTLRTYYDQSTFVSGSIGSLRDVLWIGLLLALLVTVVFLRSLKASSVVLVTIPVTLALTLAVMQAMGATFNIMTIGAIAAAIGLVIDDAIVVVEQIHRTHEEHPDEAGSHLVGRGVQYLLPAMIGSSLSTIVILLPFALMSGVAGAYFKVMTDTMIITLVCSFIVTWIGLPVVYLLFSRSEAKSLPTPKVPRQRNWVLFFLRRPWITGAFVLLLAVAGGFSITRLPSGFLPEMDEGSIVLDFDSPPGTSLEDTDRMLRVVDGILHDTPEVEHFSRRTGTQMGFFITEPSRGDYLIQLRNSRSRSTEEVSDDIRRRVEAAQPALKIDFGQVIGDMLGDLMASVQPVEVKIFGDDPHRLTVLADSVAAVIRRVPGTADVFNGITIAGPEISMEPYIAQLAQYGMTPSDFQYQMQTRIEGSIVGGMLEKNRMVDIRMMGEAHRNSATALHSGSLFLPDGRLKPINEFSSLHLRNGVAEIDRENLKPMVAVTARLNNRSLGDVLADIRSQVAREIALPPGFQIEYGGAYAEQQQAFGELLVILLLALLLVFIVILVLFRTVGVALVIIGLALLGTTGSILALLFTGTPLNVGSYTGIIMIVGIIGENAIFTYQQYHSARENGSNRDDALVFSISTRLRPKLMTALGAIAALFPLALGIGTGAQMHQPLAIAIIGGLLVALPLLILVFPTALRLLERSEPESNKPRPVIPPAA